MATEIEIAWAAGLFEGEGCWNAYVRQSGKIQMQARLGMTDADVVGRFAEIVGFGTIHIHDTPAHAAKGWRPVHTWCVYEAERVRELIEMFLPYMGDRRGRKAREVLRMGRDVRSHNAKKTHCPHGHPLEGDNLALEPIGKYMARRCRTCRRDQSRQRARKRLGITPDRFRVPATSDEGATI